MKKPSVPASVRVAVYARASVSRSLEFDSVTAQVEAISAYVDSQRGNGWVRLPEPYVDDGFSGGDTDRPAFTRLVADIDAGKVDVVASYKVDRVSRSLADFTAFMTTLERKGVGYCSVTQAFDTRSSMGKLVMNVLASFSEFERSQIAERTKDKIAAARKKGYWTGGRPPLGFTVTDKQLVIDASEAATVREIFRLFLEHGGLVSTAEELNRRGIRNKSWTNQQGRAVRGAAFDKCSLRGLLVNPLMVGLIRAGDELVRGRHEPIVDAATFEAVARALRERRKPYRAVVGRYGALLTGILRCARCGAAMTHQVSIKANRAYRYYTCVSIQKQGAAACRGSRAPAAALEDAVVSRIKALGTDPTVLTATLIAAQQAKRAQEPELVAEARRLTNERTTIEGQRRNLLDALANGGPGANTIAGRIGELDEQLGRLQQRHGEVTAQLAALATGNIDETAIRDALRDFDGMWNELIPRERARVLRLLLEQVSYSGTDGEVRLLFRANGIEALGTELRTRRPA
jgi:site-specific DNA recombinase